MVITANCVSVLLLIANVTDWQNGRINTKKKIFEINRLMTVDELQMVINEAPVPPTQRLQITIGNARDKKIFKNNLNLFNLRYRVVNTHQINYTI